MGVKKELQSSQYTGVSKHKHSGKWEARLMDHNGKYLSLGQWSDEKAAAERWDEEVIHLRLNRRTNILPNPYYDPDKKFEKRESKYKGIRWHNKSQRWEARYNSIYIGRFKDEREAMEVRNEWIIENVLNKIIREELECPDEYVLTHITDKRSQPKKKKEVIVPLKESTLTELWETLDMIKDKINSIEQQQYTR